MTFQCLKILTPICAFLLATSFLAINSTAQDAVDHPTERAEILKFFQDYQQATEDETAAKLVALYDFGTMIDEIEAQAGIPMPPGVKPRMALAIRGQIQQQLKMFNGVWYRHKVVSIKFFGADDRAEVFVRGWNEDQESSRELFWVGKSDNQWKVYDFMDISMGLACTKLAALGMQQGMRGNISVDSVQALRALMQAVALVGQDDLDGANEAMLTLRGKPVPQFIESARWFFDAAISLPQDARLTLEYLEKATAFQPDLPMAGYMRAVAYNMLGRHQLAAASAQRFINRFGDDADAYYELADALSALGKDDEAIAQLRKALLDTPNSLVCMEKIALLLPKDQKSEIAKHFENLRDHSESFSYLADSFEMEEDGEALDVLVKSMEKLDAEEPFLDYYRAIVMSARGEHEGAIKHLRQTMKKLDDDDVDWYEYLYLSEVVKADKMLGAYQAATDPKQFVRDLFDEAVDLEMTERAGPMLSAHLKAFSNDPDAHLLAGDHDYYRQRFEAADEHYAAGLKLKQEYEDITDELIHSRVLCWQEMGKTLEAYKQLEPKDKVFHELADLSYVDEPAKLAELIKLRLQDEPESFIAALWQARSMYADEDYASVVKFLTPIIKRADAQAAGIPEDETQDRILADEFLFRSLVRMDKLDEAMTLAKNAVGEPEKVFYQAIVHAVKGDEQAFKKAMKECQEQHEYDEFDFVYDVDFPDGFAGLSMTSLHIAESSPLRSIAVLLKSTLPIDPETVIAAASDAWDIRVFQEDLSDLKPSDRQYVCRIADDACVVSVDGIRLFVQSEVGPFLGDAELLAEEHPDFSDQIQKHRAWLAVDVNVWPSDEESSDEDAAQIPLRAQQLVGSLAMALAGENAIIVVDRDTTEMRRATSEVVKKLTSKLPNAAFDIEPDQADSDEPTAD